MEPVTRICFVCTGNIVRSPLAKHLFIHFAKQAGAADRYEVDSAGTDSYHVGEAPDKRMLRVAAQRGLSYGGCARRFERRDFDRFDWILAMDRENYQDLHYLALRPEHKEKIHMLREFDSRGSSQASVPDPWYGGSDGFEEVFVIVERSVRGLFEALERDRREGLAGG